jgi:hypothetical protein
VGVHDGVVKTIIGNWFYWLNLVDLHVLDKVVKTIIGNWFYWLNLMGPHGRVVKAIIGI